MKQTKKVLSIVLALVMVLAMTAVAFADGNGKITISNAIDGAEYVAYKVFDLTFDNDAKTYSYTINSDSPWFTTVEAYDGITLTQLDASTYAVAGNDSFDAEVFSKTLSSALKGFSSKPDGTELVYDSSTKTATASGLEYGYYFVTSSLGTVCMLNSTAPEVTINEKNEGPFVTKDIIDGESASNSTTKKIGDTVDYKINVFFGYGARNYVLHDKMDEGLTLKEDTIKVFGWLEGDYGAYLEEGKDYTLKTSGLTDGCTFEIAFSDDICNRYGDNGGSVDVTYSAILNEKALIEDPNTNTAKIVIPNGDHDFTYDADPVNVYTYGFDVVKTDSNDKVISDAEFKLYADEACQNEIELVDLGDGKYRVASQTEKAADGFTAATVKGGVARIDGLGNGTYYLKETKAPDGYTRLKDPVPVVINGASNYAVVNDGVYVSGGVKVVNESGSLLPGTGGIGTTIFYVTGAVLILAAAAYLIIRKRKSVTEK